jgi:hypothetical protein
MGVAELDDGVRALEPQPVDIEPAKSEELRRRQCGCGGAPGYIRLEETALWP